MCISSQLISFPSCRVLTTVFKYRYQSPHTQPGLSIFKKKTISTAVWTITDWSWISLLFIYWIIFCFKISRQFSPASVAAKYCKINTCATSLVILCYFPTTVHFHRFGILTFWIVYKYKLVFCCLTSFIKLKMSNSKDLQVDSCRILHRTFLHCDIFFLFFVSYLKSY